MIFFYRYIYRSYKCMLKKWRNKIMLYMWYTAYYTALRFPLLLPSYWVDMFHVKHYYTYSYSIFIFIFISYYFNSPSSHILICRLLPSYSFTASHASRFPPIINTRSCFIPFPFPIYPRSPHFPILQSFPFVIISQTISRHNKYHHTTYLYYLT